MERLLADGPQSITDDDMEILSDHASTRTGGKQIAEFYNSQILAQPAIEAEILTALASEDEQAVAEMQMAFEENVHLQAIAATALERGALKYESNRAIREAFYIANPEARPEPAQEPAKSDPVVTELVIKEVSEYMDSEVFAAEEAEGSSPISPNLLKMRNEAFKAVMNAKTQQEAEEAFANLRDVAVLAEDTAQREYLNWSSQRLFNVFVDSLLRNGD